MIHKLEAGVRHPAGQGPFRIDILYPGEGLGTGDSGVGTLGRIDHARLLPGALVPMHAHRDDEILSYLRSGEMIHRDRVGEEVTVSGTKLMMMNAGTRFYHEERVDADAQPVEMLQIFLRPHAPGLPPEIQFHTFPDLHSLNAWRLVAGQDDAPLKVRSQTWVFDAHLGDGHHLTLPEWSAGLTSLLYVFDGSVNVGGEPLGKGDALLLRDEFLDIRAVTQADLVLLVTDESSEYTSAGMFSGNALRRGSK